MSLFLDPHGGPPRAQEDVAMLHRMGCRVCPLARVKNRSPQMKPSGTFNNPLVYFLGEAPGRQEDEEGEPFVGPSGQMLRGMIPKRYRYDVRYNNVVRTRPHRNATPGPVEVECCRPSVVADIEATMPRVVVGLGGTALEWVTDFTGIGAWRGRRLPARVGSHAFWFYPVTHPAAIMHKERTNRRGAEEDQRMLRHDLARVFRDVEEGTLAPIVHGPGDVTRGTETIAGGVAGDLSRLEDALRWAADLPLVGVDYETRGLRPYADGAVLLSAAVSDGSRSVAFALGHPSAGWSAGELAEARHLWSEFLRRARGVKVAHNLAFELEWTGHRFGRDLVRAGRWECTQVRASILDERSRGCKPGPQSLDFLARQYFGITLKDVVGVDREDLYNTPLELVLRYNAPDAKYAALLWAAQRPEIERDDLGECLELALRRVPTVVLTQMQGVPVDQRVVVELIDRYECAAGPDDDWARGGTGWRRGTIGKKIAALDVVRDYERRRGKYNPMSNEHALYIFHEMLGRGECETTDKYTGEPKLSVDVSVLEQIDHPLAGLTLDLRRVMKMRSTYAEPLRAGSLVLYPDGMLHTNLNTTFTDTGRLSSSDPNLQNVPKRTEEGREIRRAFVARSGCVVLAFDYGQIEARVIAMLTRDERFCRALWERYDVHMEWAERVARAYPRRIGGKKLIGDKKVMKALRTDIKNQWTFPLFFGAQLASVAAYLKIPEDVLRPLFDEFWDQFSGVAEWQEDLVKFYKKRGYVECATGRRRRGPLTYNMIINSPVQGTAAEIVMDGMCRISEIGDPELQPDLNIHDDLTKFSVPIDRVDDVAERYVDCMLDVPFDFVNVPITVEMSVGRNWMEMEEVSTFSSDEWFGR